MCSAVREEFSPERLALAEPGPSTERFFLGWGCALAELLSRGCCLSLERLCEPSLQRAGDFFEQRGEVGGVGEAGPRAESERLFDGRLLEPVLLAQGSLVSVGVAQLLLAEVEVEVVRAGGGLQPGSGLGRAGVLPARRGGCGGASAGVWAVFFPAEQLFLAG